MGLVIERTVRTDSGQLKLLQLTSTGRKYAAEMLAVDPKHWGSGGIVHRYWQHHFQECLEDEGWIASLETHTADVYAASGSTEVSVEVAMGDNPREIDHVSDHLDAGVMVWVAGRSTAVCDGLRERLNDDGLLTDRVVVRPVRDVSTVIESSR